MAVPVASALANMIDAKSAAVVRTIASVSPIMRRIYFKSIGKALTYERSIDSTVPTPIYVGLNGSIAAGDMVQGSTRIVKDTVARLVLPMRLDSAIKNVPSRWEDEEKKQMRLGAVGLGLKFDSDFFLAQGLLAANFNDSQGVYDRMANGLADSTIPSFMRVSMAGQLTLEGLDELLRVTQVQAPDSETKITLFMNSKLKMKIMGLARDPSYSGMVRITEDKDAFGVPFTRYGNAEIAVVERTDNGNSALSFTETTTGRPTEGTGETGTASIWAVAFGNEQGVYAFGQDQLGMSVKPFEHVPGQLYEDSVTPWYFNFVVDGPRAVGRLHSIALP